MTSRASQDTALVGIKSSRVRLCTHWPLAGAAYLNVKMLSSPRPWLETSGVHAPLLEIRRFQLSDPKDISAAAASALGHSDNRLCCRPPRFITLLKPGSASPDDPDHMNTWRAGPVYGPRFLELVMQLRSDFRSETMDSSTYQPPSGSNVQQTFVASKNFAIFGPPASVSFVRLARWSFFRLQQTSFRLEYAGANASGSAMLGRESEGETPPRPCYGNARAWATGRYAAQYPHGDYPPSRMAAVRVHHSCTLRSSYASGLRSLGVRNTSRAHRDGNSLRKTLEDTTLCWLAIRRFPIRQRLSFSTHLDGAGRMKSDPRPDLRASAAALTPSTTWQRHRRPRVLLRASFYGLSAV
ncbi:hypothetical protein B0H13DRAFT_2653822 [Mycena leptocephala]|nr:hypothetical protein B0H13DRAFT_2653822 [Mycena leptocephala]